MRAALWVGAVVVAVGATAVGVRADVASDRAAAILVFPKIVVDTSMTPSTSRGRVDTLIRVSNTSERPITMYCFYVNANGHCSNSEKTICDPYDRNAPNPCGSTGTCDAGWHESDFIVNLTPRQPVAWLASLGGAPCSESTDGRPCFPQAFNGQPPNRLQPVPEDPFIGELKCIAVDVNIVPVERNDLKGEAEIERSEAGILDIESYNAIGIPAIPGTNDGGTQLVLGGGVCIGGSAPPGTPCASAETCPGGRCSAEYSGCPNVLILDHFFDGAVDQLRSTVTTKLTLVPCSEDFENQSPVPITVQFLVFNEFEQRFSTSNSVTCFREFAISDIDRAGPNRSIFSAAVNGTLTGQTRLRGVVGDNERYGYTLLGVAEEFRAGGGTAAFNLHFQGSRPQSDFVYLP
jgi:hypothetical protein